MNQENSPLPESETPPQTGPAPQSSRRKFLKQVGVAFATSAVLAPVHSFSAPRVATPEPAPLPPDRFGQDHRVQRALALRTAAATNESLIPVPPHTTNGDEERYPDKSGTYSKGLLQVGIGLVDPQAFLSFRKAIDAGKFAQWENIISGGTRTQNGPLGGKCFALEGSEDVQFGNAPSAANQISQIVVPPAPAVASEAYGTELVELYWGSLLRDVAFTDYASNTIAAQAAAELTSLPTYAGPRNGAGLVTPDLLFRGTYPGDTVGPYLSQLYLQPTYLGSQPLTQQHITFQTGIDFMTDATSFQQVQNGINNPAALQYDTQLRYLHDGRSLCSFTHVDVLFQAYFVAALVLGGIGSPLNPGNPYRNSTKQNGFGTFGGPDIASTLAAAARLALNSVWYQKWSIHLRHRPESGGGILRQILTGQGSTLNAQLHSNVLNSQAVQASFAKYGDYFLSQSFPEGSPAHPAYPTGHGAVAGACITILKFFYDGNAAMPNPVTPVNDGLSLVPYTGSDAGQMTVNGELNKLANNVSFAHGIHAGIHWRSDTSSSVQLGEAVAISMLQDRALCYAEPFTISFQKIDGTTATISNL